MQISLFNVEKFNEINKDNYLSDSYNKLKAKVDENKKKNNWKQDWAKRVYQVK
ncbi:hypothetical protein [Mycoplasmopsis cynos]|uniref:hypothetical protein n=1 Tax=Mycoplasmopsis cynos TaxID=171284 RepID=UPI0013EDEBAC|nr:hypothetical protein [Mycoplasmopsis cynos]